MSNRHSTKYTHMHHCNSCHGLQRCLLNLIRQKLYNYILVSTENRITVLLNGIYWLSCKTNLLTYGTSNGSWSCWCMGIKGEMSGTVCVTFTWDMYIYIWVVYSLCFLLFVHYCNLVVCVVYWVGKWRSRGSTGMFGNLMAIYHIMLQFIQNHYKSTFS